MLWSATFVGSWLRRRYEASWRLIRHIPDSATLWRAIRPDQIYRDGKIKPSFFRDRRGNYSCDLALFSTREKSRRGYAHPPAWSPDEAGLVEFTAADVRKANTDVVHTPIRNERATNYSHAQFSSELSGEEERAMAADAIVVIPPRKL
jgi:hypothetical protein